MDNKEEDIRTKGRQEIVDALNDILVYAYEAENEVVEPEKYWKASDALNRLLIKIRRRKDELDRKMREVKADLEAIKKAKEESKTETPSAVREFANEQMEERFDKREERWDPSYLDRQCWNFK